MNQGFKSILHNKTQREGALTKCGEIHINDESTDAILFCSFCMDDEQGMKFLRTLKEFIDHIKWHRSEDFSCLKEEPAFEMIEVELAKDLCELPLKVEPIIEVSPAKEENKRDESTDVTGDVLVHILDLYKKCPCLWHKDTATKDKDIIEATYKMMTSHYNKCTKQSKSVEFVKDFLVNIRNAFLEGFIGEEETMSDSSSLTPLYFQYLMFLLMSDDKKLDESIYTDFVCTICTQELSSQEDLWDHLYQCHLELDEDDWSSFGFNDLDNTKNSEEDEPKHNISCEILEKFIEAYKGQERLWNKNNEGYHKRKLRNESYSVLLRVLQEHDPAATRHDVLDKIKCFRTRFAYEKRKIEQNKLIGSEYEPHIWYYKKLLFLVDEARPMSVDYPKQNLNTNFTCSVCGKTFTNKSSWLDHLRCSHDKEAFQSADGFYYCPICNLRIKTKYAFIRHLRHSHNPNPKTCLDCGTNFQFMSALAKHRAKVHKDFRPFKCDQCGKGFANLCRMKAHSITHWDVHDRPYACEHCGAKFSNQTNLKVHIRRHTRDFYLRCEICNHSAATSTELRFHMFTHTKEYPCICDICGKGFRSAALLSTHQNECHGDKMFACELCSKEFKSLKKLQYHSESHKPLPDQVCETCGKKFFRSSSLRKHMRVKHKELENMQLFDELIDEVDEEELGED